MSLAEGIILKMAMHYLLPDEQTAINVFWAVLEDAIGSGPLDESDVLDAAANYMDALYAEVIESLPTTVVGGLVEVWEVDPATGELTPIGEESTTWEGNGAGDPFPNGVCWVCSMRTIDTDVTGRKFLSGFVETSAEDNNLISAHLARLVAFALEWATDYTDPNDVQFIPGVWSTVQNTFRQRSGTVVANAILGYQRRRKPGVGS
jgi:hypothetical protein